MSENEVSVKKPARGLFFYFKVLVVFVALLSISLFIAVYYVYHHLSVDGRLEKIIMEKASAATKMEIKFSGYELAFPGIAISNISIATDSADLKLDAKIGTVKLRPDLWAALNGELIIDSLSVASAVTMIEYGRVDGSAGNEVVGSASASPFDPASIVLPFNSIDFQEIRLSILQRQTSTHRDLVVKKANLTRSMLSSSMPFNIEGELVSVANVVADGKLYWPANVTAVIKVNSQNIAELKKLVPAAYHKQLALVKGAGLEVELKYNLADGSLAVEACHLNVDPGIKADATVKINSFSPFNASASVKVAPVDIPTLWPVIRDFVPKEHGLQVKSGKLSVNADLSIIDSRVVDTLVVLIPQDINLSAKTLPGPLQLNKGQIRYENGRIAFNGFFARFADSSIELPEGVLQVSPLSFDGELKLGANLESVYKLASGFLTPETRSVSPSGKAEFNGKLHYDSKGFKVNGALNSDLINLKENKTGAQASIEKVKVSFVDLSSAKGKIKIDSLDVKGVGAMVKIQGNIVNSADMGFDISASGNLNIEEFSRLAAGLFKLPVGVEQYKGSLSLDIKLGGSMSNLKPSGKLVLKNVSADLADRGITLVDLNGAASADVDKLVVENLSAQLLGGKVTINGSLKDFKKPVVDARAAIAGADLELIRQLIKKNVPEMPAEIEFSGGADLTVSLTGKVAEPVIKGEATLKSVRFFHPAVMRPIEGINGPITFSNSGLVASNVVATWGTSKAVVNGQLKNWAKFITDFKYSVEPLDVTDAAGFFLKDTGYKVEGMGAGSGTITGPVEKIRVNGVASVTTGLVTAPVSEKGDVFKFPYKDLVAKFTYSEKIFEITSADFVLFNGKINGNAKIYLASEPIKFEFDSKVQNILTQEFLKENTKYPDVLTGALNGTFAGSGNTAGLASLNGNSTLTMPNGTYNSPPMIKQISESLQAPQLASGVINNLAGDYSIVGGRISSKNIVGTSNYGKMLFLGSVGLDATIDGEARCQILRQVCQQSNVLRELVGNDEYLEVPITLKGSIFSPSIGMPLDKMLKNVLENRAKEAVTKEAGKFLDKLLGGGKKSEPAPVVASETVQPGSAQPQPVPEPAQPSKQKQLENSLKGLGKELNKLFKKR